MKKSFLAGLSAPEFLRRHWQKKPLLARNAFPEYAGAITRNDLFELARRDDIESRIVMRTRGRWQVRHGPFSAADFRRLPRANWTLLVQGVDHALPQAARLLREFSFIPHARVDDVMVSFAAPGGGVGPHFDSYDVFLVQSEGERRWRVSAQRDLDLEARAPLRLLRNFRAAREWTLRPGDALYLPPRYAHDGVAVGDCITCSVGFRAPAHQELGTAFLEFLQDRLRLDGRYADPGAPPARRPAQIPSRMIAESARVLERLRWSGNDVTEFLGRYLSEPKANVVFRRPTRKLARREFDRRVQRSGVRLALPSRMLFHSQRVFINGETARPARAAAPALKALADARELRPPFDLDSETRELLYQWYTAGYIETL